jgi:hypothetical protein
MNHPTLDPPTPTGEVTGRAARGFSSSSLAPVWELNAYFLEALAQSSQHSAWRGSAWEAALGPNLANVLPALRDALSRTPVSLVDLGLNDEGPRSLFAGVEDTRVQSLPPFLTRDRAVQLSHTTLTLTWTLARNDLIAASVVFGISRSQAKEIRALGFHSIPTISEKLASLVRPRWLSQPRIWQRLLASSERTITPHLAPRSVRILQRQFADLIPATPATRLLRDFRP